MSASIRPFVPCVAVAGLAFLAPAHADDSITDPPVVVTATRVPTPIDQVLAPVIVIDRDTIERSALGDAADLLRFHAGLDLARNGGPGQTTALFIRGADSNHTLVMVDGVRINPGTIGLAAIQSIPPDMIERIEVVKGPRSALWGTDAIGGVINVVTRRGTREGWTAEAGYGAYDTREASLNGGFDLGAHAGLDLGASWSASDGFPTRTTDHTDRGFDNLSLNGQLRAEVGAAQFSLRHLQSSGTTEYSDFFLAPVDQDFRDSTTAAEAAFPVGAKANAHVTVSHFEDEIDQNQSSDFLRTRRNTADAQVDWTASPVHALSAGAMLSLEQASSESYGDRMSSDTHSANVFVQDRISAGRHSALLALGYTDHETAGDAFTWNAEYGYDVTTATRLYALAGTGFRAPDATDRYGYGGNPDLKPEHSRNYEGGVKHALGASQAVQLSAFRTEVDDLIEFVTLSYDPFMGVNRNVARSRTQGVEASWNYAAGPWQARVEAICQDPRDLTSDTQLLRRAKQSLTVSVARTLGPVVLGLDVLATGERKDFGFPKPVTLDGYVLADLTARWRMTHALSLVGRIENLLNEQYELASTFNTPDRGVYVSLLYAPPRGK